MSKVCIYCRQVATTKDHVPPRCFLEKPYPNNLRTVDCCQICNNSYSSHEEYLIHILAEIGTSPRLRQKLLPEGSVYKARIRSPRLNSRIEQSKIKEQNGRIYIKPQMHRIAFVMEKIAFGIYRRDYKSIVALHQFEMVEFHAYNIEDERPAAVFMLTYSEKFQPKKWKNIQPNVFSYIVVRDWRNRNRLIMIINCHNTFWAVINIPNPSRNNLKRKNDSNQLSLFDSQEV